MVYSCDMKTDTLEPQILIAYDEQPSANRKTSADRLKLGTRVMQEFQKAFESAELLKTWHFAPTTIKTVLHGKVDAPIAVIDVHKGTPNHVFGLATSLAKRQQERPELEYVFLIHNLSHLNTPNQLKLLGLFPDPSKVAIANNVTQACWELSRLAKTWQVVQARVKPSRTSPLDDMQKVVEVTQDLRVSSGKLSARTIAGLFGFNMREFALLLGRTPQAVNQTPDAESLQDALKYFERVARVRLVLKDDEMFRKWLRMPIPALGDVTPESFLRDKKWQALADFVDDILTGAPG